jgi:hypothetical protein
VTFLGLYALALHALGDWLLQPDWMAARKLDDLLARVSVRTVLHVDVGYGDLYVRDHPLTGDDEWLPLLRGPGGGLCMHWALEEREARRWVESAVERGGDVKVGTLASTWPTRFVDPPARLQGGNGR